MRSTFRVLFYVKKGSARPNGDLPLICRLTVDGEVKQFSCKMDVPPRLWDVKNGRATGKSVEAMQINLAVDKIRVEVNRRYQELMQSDGYVTAAKLRDAYLGIGVKQETLLKLLESYNGFACVGNASEFLMSLPPVYHQTHEALRIGQKMHPAKRIYYYEDYSIYHIIEMAAESSMQKLGSRNLVHLCNNELVGLLLYDKKHNTNLVQILQAYLEHERNTTEAAKSLFIHRNTMLNKVHKIEEIIDSSLDEPMLRERLLFSCRVIEYMSRYCHEDILVLKRNMEKENEKRADT